MKEIFKWVSADKFLEYLPEYTMDGWEATEPLDTIVGKQLIMIKKHLTTT